MDPMLTEVKLALGITGTYQDGTVNQYIIEVKDFLKDAGVKPRNMSVGIVSRGVSDLWNYGAAKGKLSDYFMQRAAQLAYKK